MPLECTEPKKASVSRPSLVSSIFFLQCSYTSKCSARAEQSKAKQRGLPNSQIATSHDKHPLMAAMALASRQSYQSCAPYILALLCRTIRVYSSLLLPFSYFPFFLLPFSCSFHLGCEYKYRPLCSDFFLPNPPCSSAFSSLRSTASDDASSHLRGCSDSNHYTDNDNDNDNDNDDSTRPLNLIEFALCLLNM